MSDPAMIKGIQEAVSIPVMAKVRIGHIAEARILQAIEIDYIDESEVLFPGRRRVPHRQEPVRCAVCVRCEEPGRGAAPHRRGCSHDSHQGRARHRRRDSGRAPHAHHEQADPRTCRPARRRGLRGRQAAGRALRSGQVRARQRPSARRELRRPVVWPPRPTPP